MPRAQEKQRFVSTLRLRLLQLQLWFDKARRSYPQTKSALQRLQNAVDAELESVEIVPRRILKRRRQWAAKNSTNAKTTGAATSAQPTGVATTAGEKPQAGQPQAPGLRALAVASGTTRKWYFAAHRLRLERDALASKVRTMTGAKDHGRLSQEWLLRVFLTKPNASARSLQQSFGSIVGSDVTTISRCRLNAIRDAWVELYKPMVFKVGAAFVEACASRAKDAKASFAPVFFVHVQDEADIRLRSESVRDGPAVPSRSRSSKVQQHVLTMHDAGGRVLDLPMELEALGDKSAPTLATSFERMLRSVAASVLPQPQAGMPEVWIIHIIIGDGIATNEKAGRILWSCIAQQQLNPGSRYFLMVLKCVTHQTGLTAKSAVIGRAAAAGAGGSEFYKTITGVASRLFKYVICDYFEEFVFSVREWVVHKLEVQPAEEEDIAATSAAKSLRRLYTDHVVPQEMLRLWNNGFGCMRHRVKPGQSPEEERPRVVHEFVQWIVKHLLHVDSHPTNTRFFTFRDCVDRMMTMSLIDMPKHAFKVRTIKPRKENQKRIRAVESFFKDAEAPQTLRRASMAFQLTGGVEAMVSTKPDTGDTPVVVRLLRGEAATCLEQRCANMFEAMSTCDPSLDIVPAVNVLVTTAMDMNLRVGAFVDYPIALCRMSKKFFSHLNISTTVHDFLATPVEKLDVGVGAQLHAMAWSKGSELAACNWMISKPVQELLDSLCRVTLANSLPAERRHSEIKKWEASKLTHIATASRNAIAMRFLKWREEQCLKVFAKQKALRRAVRTTVTALLWKKDSEHCPVGLRFINGVIPPVTVRQQQAAAEKKPAEHEEKPAYLDIGDNRATLKAEKAAMVALADGELKRLLDSFPFLVTSPQWAEWLSENIVQFREKMRTAPALRRQNNVRLVARSGLPAASRRIQPIKEKRSYKSEWIKRLANRTGWWGVQTRKLGDIILFLTVFHRSTYYMELANRTATGVPTCTLDSSFLLRTCVHELSQLEVVLADDEVLQVWEFKVQGDAVPGRGVKISVSHARKVSECAQPPPRKRRDATQDESDSSVSSDAEIIDTILLPVVDTDDESSSSCLGSDSSSTFEHDDSSDDNSIVKKPLEPGSAATGASKSRPRHKGGEPLWEDPYFVAYKYAKNEIVKVMMRHCWCTPEPIGMGTSSCSKQVTPRHYKDSFEDPIKSLLLVRAWCIWRASRRGWADASRGRSRHFKDQAELLEQDVKAVGCEDRLLGSHKANNLLKAWVPKIVTRLRG